MAHLEIDYVEFQTPDISDSKDFFSKVFGWSYVDYGPDYADIKGAGIGGGFENHPDGKVAPPLVILKADDLETALADVEAAGAKITKPIFSFPGGRRFQFLEPGGNELAVWATE